MGDVIKLGEKREKVDVVVEKPTETDFEATMRKNAENKKRIEEERAKANKGVKRSYRLT